MEFVFFGPCQGHVWPMQGPCLAYFYFQARQSYTIFNTKSTQSMAHVHRVSPHWDHARAMFGPCWDHVWPSLTSRQAMALKFSRLSQTDLRYMSMEALHFGTIPGSCQDHVGAMFVLNSFRPARALTFSNILRLTSLVHKIITLAFLFWTMPRPSLDHAGNMFVQFLLPDQIKL